MSCTHTTAERHQTRPLAATLATSITKGGIRLDRTASGNVTITARGNGACEVQSADLYDLAAALVELLGRR